MGKKGFCLYLNLIFLCLATSLALAQVKEDWVARYNGPGNNWDEASAIAVDHLGNVYVAGDSFGVDSMDFTTIKYDSNGNELWVARYNGPGNGWDEAEAIAVDPLGNVYVTGTSFGVKTGNDFATIKYDSNGNELWVARYNRPEGGNDGARAIAADPLGNVYVTGVSKRFHIDAGNDFVTIKYDSNGKELWIARYSVPKGSNVFAKVIIALDSLGNVYVAGESTGVNIQSDIITIKYDPNGKELWVARYNGLINRQDEVYDIAVDLWGNVYVAGATAERRIFAAFGMTGVVKGDFVTIKYDSNGKELWVARYNGPDNGNDGAKAIAMDPLGNVYVAGDSAGVDTRSDFATIKYDSNGKELWVARYNGPDNGNDGARAIALDPLGNVYVTGMMWMKPPELPPPIIPAPPPTTPPPSPVGVIPPLTISPPSSPRVGLILSRESALAFFNRELPGQDFATIKYDPNGKELWVARYNGPGNSRDEAHAIAVDPLGNVYVIGSSSGVGTGLDFATIKYVSAPPPSLSIPTNEPNFIETDTLQVFLTLKNPGLEIIVDGYISIILPEGQEFYLNPGLTWQSNKEPMARFIPIPANFEIFNYPLLSYTFTGDEPEGTYVLRGWITKPGNSEVMGENSISEFNFMKSH